MTHGQIIKAGLSSDRANPVSVGMPVSIKNESGKAVIVPYTDTDSNFIGVALEDTIIYDENIEGEQATTPSVSYEGQIDCIAGGQLSIGDKVKATQNGFEKDDDGTKTVGIVLKGATKKGDWATVLFR